MLFKKNTDTICAITTPLGIGAIAGIRISGDKTLEIIKNIAPVKVSEGKIIHSFILDKGKTIDEVMLFFRKAPNTYTGDDEAEIFCHGGFAVPEIILELLIKKGCRLAGPGEFTQRAFLNNKMDLVQAESIMDIVNAKTKDAAMSAISMLNGNFSEMINNLRTELLTLSSLIEANLDFPEEEDINFNKDDALKILFHIKNNIEELVKRDEDNLLMKRGLTVAITGKPNVGKSSLFNLLLSEEKAIVTNVPGTTRDVLEGWLNINGIPVLIKDTAGVRTTSNQIEQIGISKTKREIKDANVILALFDASKPSDKNDRLHLELVKDAKNVFYILSKDDLTKRFEVDFLPRIDANINCKSKEAGRIINGLISNFILNGGVSLNLNDRITERLKLAKSFIEKTDQIIRDEKGLELASIEIKDAIANLSAVTGEITTDDVLHNIFSTFCVGK